MSDPRFMKITPWFPKTYNCLHFVLILSLAFNTICHNFLTLKKKRSPLENLYKMKLGFLSLKLTSQIDVYVHYTHQIECNKDVISVHKIFSLWNSSVYDKANGKMMSLAFSQLFLNIFCCRMLFHLVIVWVLVAIFCVLVS